MLFLIQKLSYEVIDCLAENINIKTQGAVTQKDLFKRVQTECR